MGCKIHLGLVTTSLGSLTIVIFTVICISNRYKRDCPYSSASLSLQEQGPNARASSLLSGEM